MNKSETYRSLVVLDETFPPDERVFNECKQLLINDVDVTLFCLTHSKSQKKKDEYHGIKIIRQYIPEFWYKKMIALAYTLPVYHWFLYSNISKVLKVNSFDVLHFHNMSSARSALWLKKKYDYRFILDLHENFPEIMKYYKHVNTLLGKLLISPKKWKKWEEKLVSNFDKTIVVTESQKKDLLTRVAVADSQIEVLANTVNKTFYKNNDLRSSCEIGFNLLYIGDTSKRRGLDLVLDSLVELRRVVPEIKLIILGKSSYDANLKQKIDFLDLGKNVSFEGWVDSNKFDTYLNDAHVGICPIEKNIHHDNTFANKIFQYMSFKLPILVSNCYEQQQLVEENKCGLVHKWNDVEDIVEKVKWLHQNKEERIEMGRLGFKLVDEFYNWENQSQKLLSVYK